MASNKIQMPMSQGGLITYYDEDNSKINLKPGHVVVMVIIIIILQLFLIEYGYTLIGLQ